MNLFLVQSEKIQEINGMLQTGSNPVIKARHSCMDILYEAGTWSSWSVTRSVCWWLIGLSWGFFPYTRRKHACLLAVSSPHISTHSPHLCVAINGFGYQLGCWFSVIPDYASKMEIAEGSFVWTICIYIRKPWSLVSQNWSVPFMQPLNCSNHQKRLQALTGFSFLIKLLVF